MDITGLIGKTVKWPFEGIGPEHKRNEGLVQGAYVDEDGDPHLLVTTYSETKGADMVYTPRAIDVLVSTDPHPDVELRRAVACVLTEYYGIGTAVNATMRTLKRAYAKLTGDAE